MTESAENELTPEEKLLKVIRDGDSNGAVSAGESAVAADTVVADNPVTAESVIADAVVEDVPGDAIAEDVAKDADSKPADRGDDATPKAISDNLIGAESSIMNDDSGMPLKAKRTSLISISFINKILAIIVVIMILLAFYEIWNNIQCSKEKIECDDSVIAAGLVDQEPEDKLPPLDDVIEKFSESKLIGRPEEVKAEPAEPVVKVTPLEDYARKNLNLIGLSKGDDGTEGIINDIKNDKMYYLTVGSTMKINDVEVKVSDITSEYVELTDGKKKIRIE